MRKRTLFLWSAIPLLFAVAVAIGQPGAIGQTPDRAANSAVIAEWARSGHANVHSPAFSNWNEGGTIPGICSTCHSGAGFRALYGLDGSEPGIPQSPIPVGGVVDCDTCHNPGLPAISQISLPAGGSHPVAGFEAACMTCHQGRAGGAAIATATAGAEEDAVNPDLAFSSPHYATAAATLLGGSAGLGYHYPGKDYEPRFAHAPPVADCTSCHNPHSLRVEAETCQTCHGTADARAIRISRVSHDGSGNLSQGIHADLTANRARLFGLMQDYADEVAGMPIVYTGSRPYFFADHNRDGRPDQVEGAAVTYTNWTPRLLKAAHNWAFTGADSGAHVHNPHYALQLIYDSAQDLANALGRDISDMRR